MQLEELRREPVLIAGVGSVGYAVARLLVTMGVDKINLVDPDHIEQVNRGAQGWEAAHVGRAKVDAAQSVLRKINPEDGHFVPMERRWDHNRDGDAPIIFCCVDDIDVRATIFKYAREAKFFIDSRMAAESFFIYTISCREDREYYRGTLFPPKEAYVASCTSKSTHYCAFVIAGLMVGQYSKWLRNIKPPLCIEGNLTADHFEVTHEAPPLNGACRDQVCQSTAASVFTPPSVDATELQSAPNS